MSNAAPSALQASPAAVELLPIHEEFHRQSRAIADAIRDHSFSRGAVPSTPLGRAFRSQPKIGYFQNCREIRELEVASFGGHGNARAMARIYAMLAGDGALDGVRIVSRSSALRASSGRTTAS